MKKIGIVCALAFSIMCMPIQVNAESTDRGMIINNQKINIEGKLVLENDSSYIETRKLIELLKAEVKWNGETQTLVMKKDNAELIMGIDKAEATYNGLAIEIEQKPFITDETSYVPLRFVAQAMGCDVTWDSEKNSVIIQKEGLEIDPKFVIVEKTYSQEDLNLLAKIVTVESGDLGIDVKLAIANEVLNRVKDSRFPSSVKKVIYQKDVHTQFPPAHKTSFKTLEPSKLSLEAAKRALEGENNIENCLYFNNRPFKSKKNDFYKKIDGEYFYR